MGVCDVCNTNLGLREGYLLTTEQVVSTPSYWNKAFSIGALAGFNTEGAKQQFINYAASQKLPWMICNNCISLFDVDKTKAREYAEKWYDTNGSFAPPGSGSVPISKVKVGGTSSPQSQKSGCFIATAVYGNQYHPSVNILRYYRDNTLSKNYFGQLFIRLYYKVSPHLIGFIKNNQWIEKATRKILDRIVAAIKTNSR